MSSFHLGQAWRIRAHELANWAALRYINRLDRYGGYYSVAEETHPTTRPAKGAKKDCVTRGLLEDHFRARDTDKIVGAHALKPGGGGRWLACDIDAHPGTPCNPDSNQRFALAIDAEARKIGFRPLTYSSNGKGGFHVVLFFDVAPPGMPLDLVPGPILFAFGHWLVRNYGDFGFSEPPETFPKQSVVKENGYGSWLRLVGRHHTNEHWAEVWNGESWLRDAEAVAHILSLTGDSSNLIPVEARSTTKPRKNSGTKDFKKRATSGKSGASDRPDVFKAYNGSVKLDEVVRWHTDHNHTVTKTETDRVEFLRDGKTGSGQSFNVEVISGVPITYCFSTNAEMPDNAGLSPSQVRCFYEYGNCDTVTMNKFAEKLRDELGWSGSAEESADSSADEKPKERKPTIAEVLTEIGMACDLFHDAAMTAYATIGRLSHPVRSRTFRHYLISEYRKQNDRKVPNAEAMSNALAAIEAAAVHDGPEHPVYVRIAGHGERVYLHLGDAACTVIAIDAEGWQTCDTPPVRFRKPPNMLPLPMPRSGGKIEALKSFLNVPDESAFALVLAWITAAFRPNGPYPLMVLLGEQGSAKSTTARVLKQLIDPSSAPIRCEPREARDLMISANNGWILAYDNLSFLPPWLSDAFCRLATGGGFATRQLYTDSEEIIFDSKRPLIVNGIEDFVTRADLLERSLLIRHPPISEERRRPESALWLAFSEAHPEILGALLDRVVGGLRTLPHVKLHRLPRMADFAMFAVACEQGAGETPRFLAAYAENQSSAHEQALDDSLVATALVAMMDGRDSWTGSPRDLLNAMVPHAPAPPPKDWPKKPNTLTNRLRRLAPNLRRVHGLRVDCDTRSPDRKRARVVTIVRENCGSDKAGEAPSASSTPSEGDETAWEKPSTCGRCADGADDPADDVWTIQANGEYPGNSSTSDDADDADDDFRPSSDRPWFGVDGRPFTMPD